jgi:hypothetical protein
MLKLEDARVRVYNGVMVIRFVRPYERKEGRVWSGIAGQLAQLHVSSIYDYNDCS